LALPEMTVERAIALFGASTCARGVVDAAYPFTVRYVNPAWELLCGYSSAEVKEQSLKLLQGPRRLLQHRQSHSSRGWIRFHFNLFRLTIFAHAATARAKKRPRRHQSCLHGTA
jgi:PAS domain-containing protein